jgi:hypothetical protein
MIKKDLFLIITSVFCLSLFSQDKINLQQTFLDAEYFFMKGYYQDALPVYLSLYKKLPDNSNLAYRIGACYINIPGQKNLSIEYLLSATKKLSAQVKEGTINQKSAPYEALFDLAKAYRVNYMFEKAKDCYQRYYETLLPGDVENRNFVENEMKVCDNAEELISKPVLFKEQNIGEPVNTKESEFNPVISANGKSLAYMVALKFYNAVMFSRLINNKWSEPVNITSDLLSDGDVFISCLSSDGKTLFLSKDDDFNSDIYSSTFNGTKWTKILRLNNRINTDYWESHGFVTDDGTRLIFASDRPGGYGGLDLYMANLENGDWGVPVNLGPQINTALNEDRPFLINGGRTLFFSSQGHMNMGGYDIFRSDLQSKSNWSEPENIGYPLNNTDDNIFFMPAGNGKTGYYSIYKESGGSGKYDIYLITFGEK